MRKMRRSSMKAYLYMKPYILPQQEMIMDTIFRHPEKDDWTAREIRQAIIDDGITDKDKCLSSSISGRVNGLKKRDILVETGKRTCEVSGRWSIAVIPSMTDYRDWQHEQLKEEQDTIMKELFG